MSCTKPTLLFLFWTHSDMPTAWKLEFAEMQTQPVTTELLALQVDDGGLGLKQLLQIGNRNKHCKRLSLP